MSGAILKHKLHEPKIYDESCPLCQALINETDRFIKETSLYVILPTKSLKGHHKRVMIVLKSHLKDTRHHAVVLREFKEFCKEYFDEEPTCAICEPKYATIPDHWHIIACDWLTDDPKEAQQLKYTPHRAIETNKEWRP